MYLFNYCEFKLLFAFKFFSLTDNEEEFYYNVNLQLTSVNKYSWKDFKCLITLDDDKKGRKFVWYYLF